MNEDWPAHHKSSVAASSLLYPDVVGHGINLDEASLNLLGDNVDIEACRIDRHGFESESIESYEDLIFYFDTSKSCHASPSSWDDLNEGSSPFSDQSMIDDSDHGPEAEIFFVQQEYFYSPLSVSEKLLKRLLARHQVFSQFANLITSFSPEKAKFYEGSTGFYASALTRNAGEQNLDELCYVLKYAEYDIETCAPVPWSIKQMGIYQKTDSKTQTTTSIIMRPSAEVWRRKDEIAENIGACRQLSEHWTGLHMFLVGTLNENWKSCLQSLDTAVGELHVPLYSPLAPEVTATDIQNVSRFKNLLLEFIHTQKLNIEVLTMLRKESRRPGGREEFDNGDFSCKYRALEWAIESTLSETKLICSHAELILSRANNVAEVLRDLITIQHNQLIRETNYSTNQSLQNPMESKIREETPVNEEQKITPDLEPPSAPEPVQQPRSLLSRFVTWISFLIPLIFTSTFLDVSFKNMNLSHGTSSNKESHFWFYVDLALLLSIVGLGVWVYQEWRPSRKRVKEEEEEEEVYIKKE